MPGRTEQIFARNPGAQVKGRNGWSCKLNQPGLHRVLGHLFPPRPSPWRSCSVPYTSKYLHRKSFRLCVIKSFMNIPFVVCCRLVSSMTSKFVPNRRFSRVPCDTRLVYSHNLGWNTYFCLWIVIRRPRQCHSQNRHSAGPTVPVGVLTPTCFKVGMLVIIVDSQNTVWRLNIREAFLVVNNLGPLWIWLTGCISVRMVAICKFGRCGACWCYRHSASLE